MGHPSPTTIVTSSPQATSEFAANFASELRAGEVILLSGELGTGKTQFVRGLCRGLGMEDLWEVDSPTFTLINHYAAGPGLYHVDLYRVNSAQELDELGLEELGLEGEIVVIEWPERLDRDRFHRPGYLIELKYGTHSAEERVIRVQSFGAEVRCRS